jgi:hypothetical protein
MPSPRLDDLNAGGRGRVGAGVDEAYAEAKRRGYEIVHPLTEEAWEVRRFFVRAPDGNVINMVNRSDE